MSKQSVYVTQMPAGCEPYGKSAGLETSTIQPVHSSIPNTEYCPPTDHGDYVICVATTKEGYQCQQATAMHTNLCFSHLRVLANEITPLREGEVYDSDTLVARAFPGAFGEQ